MLLLQHLKTYAVERPDALAFVDIESRAVLTWRDLESKASRLAAALQSRVAAGSVVIIRCPNSLEFPVAFLASIAAGLSAFPISMDSPTTEVRAVAVETGATVIFSCDRLDFHDGAPCLVLDPREATADAQRQPCEAGRLLLLSSGSTGKPKVVSRSARSLDAVCEQMCRSIDITGSDRVLATVPLCHSYGLEHGLLGPVWAGATVHLCRGLELGRVKRELTRSKITVVPGVPSMYEMLANLAENGERYPDIRAAYSAGAPLPAAVADAVLQKCGLRVGQIYGATEIGSVTYSDPQATSFRPGSVGRAMAGVEIRITAGAAPADTLPAGDVGHVWVAAPSMFDAYRGDVRSNTADVRSGIIDGFYPTGDLGMLDSAGNLTVTGRVKLLLDVGGLKVNPIEVEDVLMAHPQVGDCVVVAVRQSETVLRLKAIITARHGESPPDMADLRQFARERLAGYKVPRVFEVREALPRTATGKILRHLVQA